ncbi:MAG: ABC transporter permease subunit [Blautia sp.]|nr:ABC transporter permease subunit [Blautia sp.]
MFGLLGAIGKIYGSFKIKKALDILTDIIRGIPTIVMIFLVYFGGLSLRKSLFGISPAGANKELFAMTALAIEISAQASEMFKSAYWSIDRGQIDAAKSLGLGAPKTFRYILIPQGLRVIIPNMGNSILMAMQGTSLLFTLGIMDLMGRAYQIDIGVSFSKSFEMYVACALIYWLVAIVVDALFHRLGRLFKW